MLIISTFQKFNLSFLRKMFLRQACCMLIFILGTLRYTPEGRVGFLDFGLLCMMERKHQRAMLASIVHIVNGDWTSLVYDLTEMDVVPPNTNLRRVTMELEDALGEVTFEEAIPEIKFSKVHRRRIVKAKSNSGALPEPDAKDVNVASLVEISGSSSLDRATATPERASQTANLCVRLLLSKDSAVIRRLIMTANAKSLACDLISRDALMFRVLLSKVIVDVVCQWMLNVTGLKRVAETQSRTPMTIGENEGRLVLSEESSTLLALQEAARDRRMQVIFSKFVRELREEPVLMVRVSWSMFVISITSTAVGLHRFMVFLSEEYLPTLPPPVPPPRLVQIQTL